MPPKKARERSLGTLAGFKTTTFDLKQQLKSKSVLTSVRYEFRADNTPDGLWRVVSLQCEESLSALYTCTVDLSTDQLASSPRELLGHNATLSIHRDPLERMINGIVHRVLHIGQRAGRLECRIEIVPALYILSLQKHARIFQDMTTIEIVQEVFQQSLHTYNRSLDTSGLTTTRYLKREYCVQYDETDLQFIQRLMEEDGIVFYFEPHIDGEVLKLVDRKEAYSKITTLDFNDVEILSGEGEFAAAESVRWFQPSEQMQPTQPLLNDYDWTSPDRDLAFEIPATDELGNTRIWHDPASHFTLSKYHREQRHYTIENGAQRARDLRDTLRAHQLRCLGEGNVTHFAVGKTFRLTGHATTALDAKYVITQVKHSGEAIEEVGADVQTSHEGKQRRYWNEFVCVPFEPFWRAKPVVPRPMIPGVVPALVVGPSDQEIYTDEHGRIKVQFPWDRVGTKDERSSCWLRVMQPWAGAGWGFVFTPRIGMEVLVAFVQGDPDRPIVLGTAYNGRNRPPTELPMQATHSGWTTRSTPQSDGYNALWFDDAAGAERVSLRAQQDMQTHVLRDEQITIDRDLSRNVGRNVTEHIAANESVEIEGDATRRVRGNATTHFQSNAHTTVAHDQTTEIGGQRSSVVGGSTTSTHHGRVRVQVEDDVQLFSKGNRTEHTHGSVQQSIKQSLTVHVEQSLQTQVDHEYTLQTQDTVRMNAAKSMEFVAEKEILLRSGETVLRLTPKHTTLTTPELRVNAHDGMKLSSAKSSLQLRDTITLSASKLKLESEGASATLDREFVIQGNSVRLKTSGGAQTSTQRNESKSNKPKEFEWALQLTEPDAKGVPVPAYRNARFTATGHGPDPYEGQTDGEGVLRIPMIYPRCHVFVMLEETCFWFQTGEALEDAIDDLTQRLRQLGYGAGLEGAWDTDTLAEEIALFQHLEQLEVTGHWNDATIARLKSRYGS